MSNFVAEFLSAKTGKRRLYRGHNTVMDTGVKFVIYDAITSTFGRGNYGCWIGLIASGPFGDTADTMTTKTWVELTDYTLEDVTSAPYKATYRGIHCFNTTFSALSGWGIAQAVEQGTSVPSLPGGDFRARFRFTAPGSIVGFFTCGKKEGNDDARLKGSTEGYLVSTGALPLAFDTDDLLTIRYYARFKMAGVAY